MKKLGIALLLALGLTLIGCGSTNPSNPGNVNGNWNATLMDTGNTTAFSFGTSLVVNNDGTLSVSSFNFSTNSPCFVSDETESASFALSGNFSGSVTGKFQFTVMSGSPSGNMLVLSGTANGSTISGTWTLTGGMSCTGSGNFTMTKM